MDILFTYEGKDYRVSEEAYRISRIRLPDGRVLNILSWKETYPPQPAAFIVLTGVNAYLPAVNAVVDLGKDS